MPIVQGAVAHPYLLADGTIAYATTPPEGSRPFVPGRKGWEYTVCRCEGVGESQRALTALGIEGWEVTHMHLFSGGPVREYLLRRATVG